MKNDGFQMNLELAIALGLSFGAAIGLEHRGITRFVENELGQLGVRQLACLRLPAAHHGDEAHRPAEARP